MEGVLAPRGRAIPGVARRGPSISEPACLIRLRTGEISSCRTPAAALILVVTYSYSASESRHTTLVTRLADPVMAAANGTSACREISSPTAASWAGSTISHR